MIINNTPSKFPTYLSVIIIFIFSIIRCGNPIDSLIIEYSEHNIKLTRCPICNNVADKYIEYEMVLVIFDIILLKKQSFRHLIFNRIKESALHVSL